MAANERRLLVRCVFCCHRHRFSFGSSLTYRLYFYYNLSLFFLCAPVFTHCFALWCFFVSCLTYFYCCPLFAMFDFTLPAPDFTSAFFDQVPHFFPARPPSSTPPFCVCRVFCVMRPPCPWLCVFCWVFGISLLFRLVFSGVWKIALECVKARSNSSDLVSLVPRVMQKKKWFPKAFFFSLVSIAVSKICICMFCKVKLTAVGKKWAKHVHMGICIVVQ